MGRLGIAGRIVVLDIDTDDTLPSARGPRPTYSDCVALMLSNDESCDRLAHEWLDLIGEDV